MFTATITKDEIRGAHKYYGLFYAQPDRVISKLFIARTDAAGEKLLCYDFAEETWEERHKNAILQWLNSGKHAGELSEMTETDALWFLERANAFRGAGNDDAVEVLLQTWKDKMPPLKEAWYSQSEGWPAKYVETSFYLNGKAYSIKPDDIGLETGNCWDEGLMENLQGDIGDDLEKLGATEIRHIGFLD